jgi:hypothetical protein
MATTTADREQRRHQRYRVKENAIAFDHSIIGQILNLSMGGLKFRYLADLYKFKGDLAELDLYFAGEGLCLHNIPCETVFNKAMENESPYSSLAMRECGVKFGQFTEQQTAQLRHILTKQTAGEV